MTLRQAFKLLRRGLLYDDVRYDRLGRAVRRCAKYGAFTKHRAPQSEARLERARWAWRAKMQGVACPF